MTRRMPFHRLVVWGSLALATLTGCPDHSTTTTTLPTAPTPPPTESILIFVGGQCHVAASAVVCRDASRSEPQGRLAAIDWELINTTSGLSQGSTPSAPGGEISFTGLATGRYQVNQTVSAQDRTSQMRTYGPLIVGF
jgi:hypothetical protein